MRIAFVHPDLGIGGAERLVVDAAVGLQHLGHSVAFYTSHHDPTHCFEETRDGTLQVTVLGDAFIPRQLFGRFHVVFAILRSFYVALWLCLRAPALDVIFADQVSASIPVLRWTGSKVLFYCHFPDKLLAQRESLLKGLYRYPVDKLEEVTTGMADSLAVNSNFTAETFRKHFPTLRDRKLSVIYPGIRLEAYDRTVDRNDFGVKALLSDKRTFVSLNRFERKKNLALAIRAFAKLKPRLTTTQFGSLRLVVAGGYDKRVAENVEHHVELTNLAESLGLSTFTLFPKDTAAVPSASQVVFLLSFSAAQRTYLLATSLCLAYTPSFEHFGIVPTEAMYAGVPVVAVDNGGPKESVVDGVTGFLRAADDGEWAEVFANVVGMGDEARSKMGREGRKRVEDLFSATAMARKIDEVVKELAEGRTPTKQWGPLVAMVALILSLVAAVVAAVR